MFHHVFCRNDRPTSGQDVANWVMDAAAFEEILRYTDAACAPRVESAVTTLRERGYLHTQADLIARLREAKQVFAIELDELLADEEVWELLDSLEARIARELDGVIYANDEGFSTAMES